MSSPDPGAVAPDPRQRAAAEARSRLRDAGHRPDPSSSSEAVSSEAVSEEAVSEEAVSEEAVSEEAAPPAPAPTVSVPTIGVPGPASAPPAARPAPAPPTRPSRGARATAAVLGVVSLGLAIALVVTLLDLHHDHQAVARARAATARATATSRAERTAVASARTFALDLASYRYGDLAADEKRILAGATPSFRKSYATSTDALDRILKAYKASASAKVLAAAVESATPTQVVVLLFVNQTATSTRMQHATTEESRLQMTLVLQRGRWLIDKVVLE